MVLEGVHLVPGLVEPPPEAEQAVVARCILEIEDPRGPRDALLRPRHLVGRSAPGRPVPRPLRRDQADPGRARHARATRRRCRDRVRERRRSRDARPRPRAGGRGAGRARPERTAALPVRVVRARDRACCTRRRAARPCRRRGRRGGDLLRDARLARRAADQRTHRDRRARGRGAAAGGRDRRGRGEAADLALDPLEGRGVVARGGAGGDVDDRRRRARLATHAAGHVHAQDGGRSTRARVDRPQQADRGEHQGDRRCGSAGT